MNDRAVTATPVGTDDLVAIQRLVHRYSEAVVLRDGEQWADCWADDAVWDLGRGRPVHGKQAIVEFWRSAMAGMSAVVQMVHNGDADHDTVDEDRAVGRWFIDERYCRANGERGMLLAHYDDAYLRHADGIWRFSSRSLFVHYHGAPDLSAEFQNTAERLAGGHG